MVKLSIVSPVFGCAGSLEALYRGVADSADVIGAGRDIEIIFVNDGSPDTSWEVIQRLAIRDPRVRGLRLSRNFGQHAAIIAGLEASCGEWVVVMDCDLQDPPATIPRLYREAVDSGSEIVFALRENRKDSVMKRLSSWAFFKLLSWLTGVRQDGRSANFGVFHRSVIDAVCSMPERQKAFPLMVRWAGFRVRYVPVEHAARAEGKSSYTIRKLLRFAIDIALSYSDKPLRMVAGTGIAFAIVAVLIALYSVIQWIEGNVTVAGFTSLMASIWLLGGVGVFAVGVVGLYVGSVFRNVQGRPVYIVAEQVGGSDQPRKSDGNQKE
jgi:dolichol-phosphate mannosyltransferase